MFKLSKPRCRELSMCFHRYDKNNSGLLSYESLINLLYNIGIHLTESEKKTLRFEYETQGGFTLSDLLTLGETFYTNQIIKSQIEQALLLLSDGKKINTKLLYETLIKLGTKIRLEEDSLHKFLYEYCQADEEIEINTFIST